MPWCLSPQNGGNKIPTSQYEQWRTRVDAFAENRSFQLSLRFKGHFCYVDVTESGETTPSPLCRLRYFSDTQWSMAFYTWSRERYEPCLLSTGQWQGSLEEALTAATFLLN
jgi:hypothetical protein